jgi:hypothetical protein
MNHARRALAAIVLMASIACSDESGPAGPAEKALEFTLSAPSSVPTKQVIEIEVRVTQAALVNYPLAVTFEEANLNEPYAVIASVLLQKPEDVLARISEEAARDPLYRVTITEAGGAAVLSVSRTVQVDVLDFP